MKRGALVFRSRHASRRAGASRARPFVLVTAALTAGAAACGSLGAASSPGACARASTNVDAWNGRLLLDDVAPDVRRAIADRVARGRLLTVSVRRNESCGAVLEVLRCTRPIPWRSLEPVAHLEPFGDPRALVLTTAEQQLPRSFEGRWGRTFDTSWRLELDASGYRDPDAGRLGPTEEPPVDASELAGPDCDRATHVAMLINMGAFRTIAVPDRRILAASACQPGMGCEEPIQISGFRPVSHRGCPTLTTRTPGGCTWIARPPRFARPVFVPRLGIGNPCDAGREPRGPIYAQALALRERGEHEGAARLLERVGAGEASEPPGNVHEAQVLFAQESVLAGDMAGAVGAFEAIANNACNSQTWSVRTYLALARRRATVPPVE